jgi:hypothetical protein
MRPEYIICGPNGLCVTIYRAPRPRSVWGRAIMLTLCFYALLIVVALAQHVEDGHGVICEEANQIFEIYDQMVADGGGGWDSTFKAINAINARSKRDACYHAPVKGVPGPIVVTRGYQFGEVDVREAMIHAILVRGEWQHLPTPRLYYTGSPAPLVSQLKRVPYLTPAERDAAIDAVTTPTCRGWFVPAAWVPRPCYPGYERSPSTGRCVPDCKPYCMPSREA